MQVTAGGAIGETLKRITGNTLPHELLRNLPLNMSVFCINKICHFPPSSGLSAFHYALFHGLVIRSGDFGSYSPTEASADESKPAFLLLNLFKLSAILQPSNNFICHQSIRASLGEIQNAIWQKAVTKRVCQIPYEIHQKFKPRVRERPFSTAPEREMIHFSESITDKSENVPVYWELIAPSLDSVTGRSSSSLVRCNVKFPVSHEERQIEIPKAIQEERSIIWHEGFHILSHEAFVMIEQSIDRNFFEIAEISM